MKINLIDVFQFSEWAAERYNYIGGDVCHWFAKQYDLKDKDRHKTTGELFKYWLEEIKNN